MMSKLEDAKIRGTSWISKVRKASEHYDKWEREFKCKRMVRYYDGKQWENDPNGQAYVKNLIFSTIAVKEPALIFSRPQFFVSPKPSGSDFNPEEAFAKCMLATDTLNTLVSKKEMAFTDNIEAAIHDSFFRFGMIEVGYDATWKDNPNANKPSFKNDYDPQEDTGKIEDQPAEIPEEEWIYTKRIPAERFRVGTDDCFQLEKANWVGYYEYMRLSDIKARGSGFTNIEDLPEPTSSDDEFIPSDNPVSVGDLVKIWKLWDLRSKKRFIVMESSERVIFESTFKRLPLFGLKFSRRTIGWYPVPVVFNWKAAQDEVNESHEQMRTHRRRSKRAFQCVNGGADPEETEKLINGPDGVTITVNRDNAIQPIGNTPVDSSIALSMQVSEVDFNSIAGTSSEDRLQADRATATQSTIINNRANLRESKEQAVVASWMNEIALEILTQAIEKLSQPIWIKLNADTGAWGGEYQSLGQKYEMLHTDILEGVGFNVEVQVSSMSPVTNDEEMNRYMRFVSFLTQFPLISLHPSLIRESAYRLGYRNEKVIGFFMEAAQLSMIGKMEEGKAQAQQLGLGDPQASGPSQDSGGMGGNPAQKTVNEMAPPELAQIAQQLGNVGVPQ